MFLSSSGFSLCAQNVTNIVGLVIVKNMYMCFLNEAPLDFQEGPRMGPKRAGSAPAGSQGALGKVDQVHWGPFWEALDLQNVDWA